MHERNVPFGIYKGHSLSRMLEDKEYCQQLLSHTWIHTFATDWDIKNKIDIRDRILRHHPDLLPCVPSSFRNDVAIDILLPAKHLGCKQLHSTHSFAPKGFEPDVKDEDSEVDEYDTNELDDEEYSDEEQYLLDVQKEIEEELQQEKQEQEEDNQYEIEQILQHKVSLIDRSKNNPKCMYLIKWKGYDENENSWVSEDDVSSDSLFEYWKQQYFKAQSSSNFEEGVSTKPGEAFSNSTFCIVEIDDTEDSEGEEGEGEEQFNLSTKCKAKKKRRIILDEEEQSDG